MENYEINRAFEDFKKRLAELKEAMKLSQLINEHQQLTTEMENSNFWNDAVNSTRVLKKIKSLKEIIEPFKELDNKLEELEFYFEMLKKEEENLRIEVIEIVDQIENNLKDLELKLLLSKEYDDLDAIIDMHPGAGGTESQDWCDMLYRMYRHYCEDKNYSLELLDYQAGEEAGIKSVSFIVHGPKSYGHLKGEQGVHRLVRISPFDSNSRRHTSFCSVTITPAIENEINLEIKPEDIKIDTYRSSGAGGQSVNTTDSAIRITHFKSGIVVTCQNERSQIQNREKAMLILKSKLYQLEIEDQNKKIKGINGDLLENAFGSQIRSYVFHPYSLVKDHRTEFETGNINAVMDGQIDGFINAYLKSSFNVR